MIQFVLRCGSEYRGTHNYIVCVCELCCVCVFAAEFVSVSDSKSRFLLKRFKVSTSIIHHV